jgi:hypothetical protein
MECVMNTTLRPSDLCRLGLTARNVTIAWSLLTTLAPSDVELIVVGLVAAVSQSR